MTINNLNGNLIYMLIETKQIVTKTQLRRGLNRFLDEVKRGRPLLVTDRGQIITRLMPAWYDLESRVDQRRDLLRETINLAQKMSGLSKNWQSLKALKKSRQERLRRLS